MTTPTQDLLTIAGAEFDTWRAAVSDGPSPLRSVRDEELPPGWEMVADLGPHPIWGNCIDFLVHRAAGGWMVFRQRSPHAQVHLIAMERTLADLYLGLCGDSEVITETAFHARDAALTYTARGVERYLVTLLDPTDPVEAAERTVVALGGRLTVVPHAATLL